MQGLKNIDSKDVTSTSLDSFNILTCNPGAFAGGTTDARGDKDGAKAVLPLFKVTGTVLVRMFGICTTTLVGAGTLEVGMAGNTAGLLAQIANATDLAKGEIYNDATPTELGIGLLASVLGPYIVTADGTPTTIDEKVTTTDITAGGLYYVLLWRPLTPNGKVESLF
jgi:hypothetical protein